MAVWSALELNNNAIRSLFRGLKSPGGTSRRRLSIIALRISIGNRSIVECPGPGMTFSRFVAAVGVCHSKPLKILRSP